jgi:DNA-binding transcriptional MerR regulator
MSREEKKPISFGKSIKLSVGKAAREYLSTGRVLRKSSPIVELIAYEYAKSSLGLAKPMGRNEFIKAMSQKHDLPTKKIQNALAHQSFESALASYLPLDEITERHAELMHQNENLAVAADMVKLGYKVHDVGQKEGQGKFATFLQQINNYGEANNRESQQSFVETVEPLQD